MAKVKKPAAPPLIEAVRPTEADGVLISAVLSTYGLSLDQPPFFEQDFLPSLFGLGSVKDRGYAIPMTLERKLKDVYTTLVCDAHALAAGARPSLQIDVLPVGRRTNHAKIVLIHRKRRIRLVVGSSNLTHEGYRRQREISAILDFGEEGRLPASVLRQAVDGWVQVLGDVATPELRRALSDAVQKAESWQLPERFPKDHEITVVFGGGPRPLFQAVVDAWPEREPLLDWYICSPFWPDPTGGKTPFEAIAEGLAVRGAQFDEARLTIVACGDSPGERSQPRFPFMLVQHLRDSGFPVRQGRIVPARLETLREEVPEEMAENQRELHAKWVILRGPRTAVVLLGSANFTRKGLGVMANTNAANIEACVLLRVPASTVVPDAWMPPIAEKGIVDWAKCGEVDLKPTGAEDELPVAWPDFIHRIELTIRWEHGPDPVGQLRVVLAPGPHPDFTISLATEDARFPRPLIASITAASSDAPLSLSLDTDAVRRILTDRSVLVTWDSPQKRLRFPVNIEDASKAGLPSVLGVRPDEQQLLAYFHGRITEEDLVEHLERRAQQGNGQHALTAQEAERLKRLQSYLLRDFVESLFGLAETLRQSMRSPRAFEQALIGDFSPACLAEQVLQAFRSGRRSPTAAAFQFVELIRVVARLDLPDQTVLSSQEHEALEEARAKGVQRLLQIARDAVSRADFRATCTDKDFTSYVRTCLPKPIADSWANILLQRQAEPAVTETTEGLTVP